VTHRFFARTAFWTLALALILALAPRVSVAADKKPLPATVVQLVDGAPMQLDQSATSGQWLFIYLLPESPASQRLIDAMRGWDLPSSSHVAVVVGGDKTAAAAFARVDHGLPFLQWALDPDRSAWQDLQVSGVPSIFGIRNGLIEWRLSGVLNDPSALKSVIVSWMAAQP
jgi:hypothetical protein